MGFEIWYFYGNISFWIFVYVQIYKVKQKSD